MNPRNDWKELLIRYHSGELDAATVEQLERQLEQSPELQQQLEHVKEIDRFLQRQSKLEQPSKKFTEQVMYSITLPANSTVMSSKTGWFLLISILSITGVALIFLANGFFDSEGILGDKGNWYLEDVWEERIMSQEGSEFYDNPYKIVSRLDSRGQVKGSTGLVLAIGRSFKSGYLNIPFNLWISPRKEGTIGGFSFGFNVSRKPK